MARTARVFVWAARGNRTVDVRRLSGPDGGEFVPPPYLTALVTRDRYDLGVRSDRHTAYELLLTHGTAEDITGWVNLDLLARSFDDLCLAPHVVGPWRRALRDLELLPDDADDADDAGGAGGGAAPDSGRAAGPRSVGVTGADSPEVARSGPADSERPGRGCRAGDSGTGLDGPDGGARGRPGEHDGTGTNRPTVPAA